MSPRRKTLVFCILVLLFYLSVELLSFAGFSLANKKVFSWSALQAERYEVIYGDPEEKLRHSIDKKKADLKQKKKTPQKEMPIMEIIHPYLGFVFNKNRPDCSEYGFIDKRVIDNPTAPVTEKTEDNYIVLILGGSFAYGTSAASTDGYLEEQLRTLPPLRNKKIIVHTGAIGGYKQPQQLIALNYFLSLGAHFDLILNIDGFNEIALPEFENVAKNVNPFFPRMWWMRVGQINDQDLLVRLAKIELVKEKRKDIARILSTSPLRYSVTGNLFWQLYDRQAGRKTRGMEEDFTRYRGEAGKKLRFVARGPAFNYKDEAELYQDLAGVWRRSSLQINHISRANNIDYFHFLQPNQYVKDSKPMLEDERKKALLDGHLYKTGVEKGYPYLIEAGRKLAGEGVAFHDLTMIFADNNDFLYRDACCHLNEKGYNLIIDRMIAEIRDKYNRGEMLSVKKTGN